MIKASLKKLSVATFVFLILLLALSPVSPIVAHGLGHAFYGTVKINGGDAAVGTVIIAQVDGTEYGSSTVTTPGQYALIVQGDIDEGATIHFYIDGQEADQTFPFHDGWTTELDLTAPALPIPKYALSITAAPGVGGAATDETGGSPYAAGAEVSIKAVANPGYSFVSWTALAGDFDDENAEETNFTMPAQNVTVTAHFEEVSTPPEVPTVTTQAATDITSYSAIVNMSYTVGIFNPVEVRFACKRFTDPAWFYTTWVSRTADGTYAEVLTGLTSQTEYEFKAQLKYNGTLIEGATSRFTTARGAGIGLGDLRGYLGCFIATAAYGTPMAEEIEILRDFRDEYLLTNPLGQAFVDFYYSVSPPMAEFITKHPNLKPIVRAGLLPVVAMSAVAVNTTIVEKMAILGLLVLVSVALAVWAKRRRSRGPEYT